MAWLFDDWLSYTGDPIAYGAHVDSYSPKKEIIDGSSKGGGLGAWAADDDNYYRDSNDNYSSSSYEAKLKKEAQNKAKVLESEYAKSAESLKTAAKARQQQNLLALQNAQKDLSQGKDIAGRTRRQTEGNSRWQSDNDFFKAQNSLQNTRRYIGNAKNAAYGSIGNTINELIHLQNGKNNHNIADTLQTNLQSAADTYVSAINNLNSTFNKQYDQAIQNQMSNQEEFRQGINQTAADFYSQIAALGDYVYDDYFTSSGARKNVPSWAAYADNPSGQGIQDWSNGVTLSDGTKLYRISDMMSPERVGNVVDINEVQKSLERPSDFYTDNNNKENKSYKSFRSPQTEEWTQG